MTSPPYPSMPPSDQTGSARSAGRPGQVTAAAVLSIIQAVLSLLTGVLLVSIKQIVKNHTTKLTSGEQSTLQVVGVVVLIVGVLLLVAAIGLLRDREWARLTVFVIEGIAVLGDLVSIVRGEPGNLVGLVLAAVVIGLLLSGPANSYFRRARPADRPSPTA